MTAWTCSLLPCRAGDSVAGALHRPPAVLAGLEAGQVGSHDVLAEALGGGKQAAHSGYPVLARMATDRSKWHNEHAP